MTRAVKWLPTKPRTPLKTVECGGGHWDERDYGLDYPAVIDTINFRVTGSGHERIEKPTKRAVRIAGKFAGFNEKQPEHRIAAWI